MPATPLVGIGMSNGSRFVTLWGQTLEGRAATRSRPSGRAWAGSPTRSRRPGELTVPTVFSTAENDFTSPPGPIIVNFDATRQAGTPTELYVSRERNLGWARYMRIPGIDQDEARQIYFSLVATGVWNGDGERVVSDVEEAAARVQSRPSSPARWRRSATRSRTRPGSRSPSTLHRRVRPPGGDLLQPLRAAPNEEELHATPCPCLDRDRRAGAHELRPAAAAR